MNNIKKNHFKQGLSNIVSAHYSFIEPKKLDSREEIISDIIIQIKENTNFSLGEFSNEEKLGIALARKIFGPSEYTELISFSKEIKKIKLIVEKTLQESFNQLPISGDISLYIIPFCNKAASDDLGGVNGFAVEKNIFYILININNPNWEKSLVETIPHEYAHIVYTSYFEWNSILDGFVNEGLAEKFRELVVKGNVAPWSKALEKEKALEELKKIPEKEILNLFIDDSNVDFYVSYFFGTGDLQKWYGYSIGYWLIDEIISTKKITLIELFKKSPKEVFNLWKRKNPIL